jgi:hypothetical protein
MPGRRPAGEQRGQHLAVILLGEATLMKRSLRSSSSARSVSTGSMTTNASSGRSDVPLDQRQRAAADRAEADHHDRAVETWHESGWLISVSGSGVISDDGTAANCKGGFVTPPRANAASRAANQAGLRRQLPGFSGQPADGGASASPARARSCPRRRRARRRSSRPSSRSRSKGPAATARRSSRPRSRSGRNRRIADEQHSDVEGLQRREAVEGDRGVGRRVGAGALDQHLVADLQLTGSG